MRERWLEVREESLLNIIPDNREFIQSISDAKALAEKAGNIMLYRGTKGVEKEKRLDSAKKIWEGKESLLSLSYSNTPFMCSIFDSGPTTGARALDYMMQDSSIPYALALPLKEFSSQDSLVSKTVFCAPLTPLAGIFFSGELHSRTKIIRDAKCSRISGIWEFEGKDFPSSVCISASLEHIKRFQHEVDTMIAQYATPLGNHETFNRYIQNQKTWLEKNAPSDASKVLDDHTAAQSAFPKVRSAANSKKAPRSLHKKTSEQ